MSNVAAKQPLTYAEYVAFERASEMRHEFADGEIFDRSGRPMVHNSIVSSVLGSLGLQLRRTRLHVFGSNMRVRTGDDAAAYPDVTVVDSDSRHSDETRDELLNPSVIVEVLSESTERYDRGAKFDHYRTIASLAEYVLVASDRIAVDVFVREADGRFRLDHYGAGETIRLGSIECELVVDEVYEKSGLSVGAG
jgi:Uma2 family endonuclease